MDCDTFDRHRQGKRTGCYGTDPGKFVFLDFSGRNFDGPVTITPSVPTRVFWENMYKVSLDDLSSLVAPQRVVICEGRKDTQVEGFDARCYNKLFTDEYSEDALYITGRIQ